jgi:hypothetical protein
MIFNAHFGTAAEIGQTSQSPPKGMTSDMNRTAIEFVTIDWKGVAPLCVKWALERTLLLWRDISSGDFTTYLEDTLSKEIDLGSPLFDVTMALLDEATRAIFPDITDFRKLAELGPQYTSSAIRQITDLASGSATHTMIQELTR